MGTILYKRLFEVRVLHDYFLSKQDLTSIYALNNNDKIDFLNNSINLDQYDIRKFLEIIPSISTLNILKNFQIRMVLLPSGFLVGVKVKPQLNGAGEEEYLPTMAITDALQLGFRLKIKKANFNAYTNLKIQEFTPAHYFFSNNNASGLKVFPSLSLPVSNFQAGKIYETGELAIVSGVLQEALEETSNAGASFWKPVTGSGFANEQDRVLLPKLFPYTASIAMASVEFTLKKPDSSEVKSITASNVQASQTLYLDFRQTIPAIGDESREIVDGHYLLEISSDISTATTSVYLSDELYQSADTGALVIETNGTDPAFRILNSNGTLITKKKADGTFIPHPVYEIRFKRRGTYWRYRSDSGKTLKTTTNTAHFLNEDGGNLITKDLRPLTYYSTFFEDPALPAIPRIHLPNPSVGPVKKEMKRFFSDLYVSPIKGLIDLV